MFGWKKKTKIPQVLVKDIHQAIPQYTHDLWELEQHVNQRLFIYDNTQVLSEEAARTAYTQATNFSMFKTLPRKEARPVALENVRHTPYRLKVNGERVDTVPLGRVKGSLLAVRPSRFIELDNYYKNGVIFTRHRVNVLVPYEEELYMGPMEEYMTMPRVRPMSAWMYTGKVEYWTDKIDKVHLMASVKHYPQEIHSRVWGLFYDFRPAETEDESQTAPSILKLRDFK
jgi:hypothetical protein